MSAQFQKSRLSQLRVNTTAWGKGGEVLSKDEIKKKAETIHESYGAVIGIIYCPLLFGFGVTSSVTSQLSQTIELIINASQYSKASIYRAFLGKAKLRGKNRIVLS